jgi:hypothetical protein
LKCSEEKKTDLLNTISGGLQVVYALLDMGGDSLAQPDAVRPTLGIVAFRYATVHTGL